MPELICPSCRAELEPDLVERTGEAACPFCGADVSQLPLEVPAAVDAGETDNNGIPELGESSNDAAAVSRDLTPLPTGSKLQTIEASAERLVFYIPAGGK